MKFRFKDPAYQYAPGLHEGDNKMLNSVSQLMAAIADGARVVSADGKVRFPSSDIPPEEVTDICMGASLRLKTMAIFASMPQDLRNALSAELIKRENARRGKS